MDTLILKISTLILFLSAFTTLALSSTPFEKWNQATVFNSSIASGPSNVQFVPEAFGFDGPKLDSVNASVFDWWYFQAMAPPLSSFVIVFFTSTANAFPYLVNENNVLPVWIWASFDNGTVVSMQTHAEKAAIYTSGNGSTGIYDPIGMQWAGSRDMSTYHIRLNNNELGIKGTMRISSGKTPVYPCGPPGFSNSMELLPNIGWANAVPFGVGDVNMNIHGSSLRFRGLAYHDKNWGDTPLSDSVRTWYWGQATIGKYVLIWFDIVTLPTTTDTEYKRLHIFNTQTNTHIYSSCADNAVTVRPYDKHGNPQRFPPQLDDPAPHAMRIVARTPAVNITVAAGKRIAGDQRTYTRWLGGVQGCVYGECGRGGMGVMEQMVVPS